MDAEVATFALSSLRMDKGEDLEYAMASIKRMAARKPVYYAYDIICTTEQLKEANRLLPIVIKEIRKQNPQLQEENLYAGITTDPSHRPDGAEMLFANLIDQGLLDPDIRNVPLQDIYPQREENWK